MSLSFTITELPAKVTSVNFRPEKHGKENAEIGVDVSFKGEIAADEMNQLSLGDPFAFEEIFYDKEGDVVNVGIDEIKIDRVFEEHDIDIVADDLLKSKVSLQGKIKDIYLKPVYGRRMEIRFKAQIHPGSEEYATVANLYITGCVVSTKGSPLPTGEEKEPEQADIEGAAA